MPANQIDATWWQSMPGRMLMQQEKALLHRWLKNAKNMSVLQIGGFDHCLMNNLAILHVIDMTDQEDFGHLPVQSESIDIVLISHVLTTDNLQTILKECYRVLKPSGQLLMFGLNKMGFWRLCYAFGCCETFFKGQTFLSVHQIKKAVRQLEMQILCSQTICFRPPLRNKKTADQLMVLDLMGQFLFPSFGAGFMMVALKEAAGVTAIPVLNNQKQLLWNTNQVRQTTRSYP